MGNSMKQAIKHFTEQATYSSGKNSSSSDRNIVDEDKAEYSIVNSRSTMSSFVAIGGGGQEDIPQPDSGWVSAEASRSTEASLSTEASNTYPATVHETGLLKEGEVETEEKKLEEGEQQETGSCLPVYQVPNHPSQPVQHSSGSSPISPPSSSSLSGRSPNFDSTDASDGRVSTLTASSQTIKTPLQESCGRDVTSYLHLSRRQVLQEVVDKISVDTYGSLKIPILTYMRQCYARLTYTFISYIPEQAEWPDRFCRMSFHLAIPKKCVEALTVSRRCTTVITVVVSSSMRKCSDLTDGRRPLTLRRVVTPGDGNMELVTKCEVVRHTTLLDAHCVNFHVKVSARFELQEVTYTCDEEGMVTVAVVQVRERV